MKSKPFENSVWVFERLFLLFVDLSIKNIIFYLDFTVILVYYKFSIKSYFD